MPRIRREETTQLTVYNDDDPPENQRSMSVTVETRWWSQAHETAKQLMWRGLLTSAIESWSNEDRHRAAMAMSASPAEHPLLDPASGPIGQRVPHHDHDHGDTPTAVLPAVPEEQH